MLVAVLRVRARRAIDAAQRSGLRIDGVWWLFRTELDAAGRQPAQTFWVVRVPDQRRPIEVLPDVAPMLDPDGVQRLAVRLRTGNWPGGATASLAGVEQRGALVVGRRSGVLVGAELAR